MHLFAITSIWDFVLNHVPTPPSKLAELGLLFSHAYFLQAVRGELQIKKSASI
jgi:hypothetical protein